MRLRASDRLIEALNEQVGNEMYASMKYVSIATYFDSETLPTLARFFYRQSDEERVHAMKFVRFILELGGRVRVPAIPQPTTDFESAEHAVALALSSEERVTGQIQDLVRIAEEEQNFLARSFLNWFLDEQLEEEDSMESLLNTIRRAGSDRLLDVEAYLEREASATGTGTPVAE
ncbi:MAG: ferritin [Acidobacteria bacterium]|nr:ferritin [Acidobacteriota bacterium]